MKKCKRCLEVKDEKDFYKHSRMKDGYLSFCKSCVKKRISNYRIENVEIVRENDRARFQRRKYNPKYIKIARRATERYREKTKIGSSIAKKLRGQMPDNCSMCSVSVKKIYALHGHHENYKKPLKVIWVCPACHKQIHLKK